MTNSLLRYAPKAAALILVSAVCGCGGGDGTKELEAGRRAYGVHDLKKAEKLFAKCLELAPDNADACLALARVKLELGEIPAAAKAVGRAVELAGNDADVIALAAEVAWYGKDYDKAHAGFRRLAGDADLEPAARAVGWTGMGIVDMSRGAADAARIAFLLALRADSRNASARYHLGLLYRNLLNFPEAALEQFEIFVRLQDGADARVQRVQHSVIPELRETIARKATAEPGAARRDSAASAKALAKAEEARRKKNVRAAQAAYEEALKADPLSYPAANGLATLLERTQTSAEGRARVLDYYRMACRLRPTAVKTLLAAGTYAAKIGQHSTAAKIFSQAMAAEPTDISVIDGLIRAQRKCGRGDVADAYQRYRDMISVRRK